MRIAIVSTFGFPLPPPKYGAVERCVYHLAEELVDRGHNVHVFCRTGSTSTATIHEVFSESDDIHDVHTTNARIEQILLSLSPDIVHSFATYSLLRACQNHGWPTLKTFSGVITEEHAKRIEAHPSIPASFLSRAHLRSAPATPNAIGYVYNGVEVDTFPFSETPGDYLVFLGRIKRFKGLDDAIRIARGAHLPLYIGGPIADQSHFDIDIAPHIDGEHVLYLGNLDWQQKTDLLLGARALLMPIKWDEPFGLVMTEAMACGTPVIAYARGAVPELITHGITGFHLPPGDIPAAIDAVSRLQRIDRTQCRARVTQHFSVAKMTDGYERLYNHILKTPFTLYS